VLVVSLLACAPARGQSGRGMASSPAESQAGLRRQVESMTAHLAGRSTREQVIADAERLASSYRALGPVVRGFGPADYAVNRLMARRSLDWLAHAGRLYSRDPLVAQAVLASYESIGGFYRDYGRFYQPGAFVAYASATRLAQRLILEGLDVVRYERELNRFALAYGAFAVVRGSLVIPWTVPRDLPDSGDGQTSPALGPVELPRIDVSELDAEQRAAWADVRDRFRSVAPRVHQARVLLDDLSGRLRQQGLVLNASDAANAMTMQSYLEDAADLIAEKRFDLAFQALTRADYVRVKLRSVTGQ
jgi:hypothetical protein